MPKPLALVVVGLLTLFVAGGVRQGCQDLVQSSVHLRYFPIRDMRRSVAILPQRTMLLVPDSASVPVTGIDRDLGRDVLAKTLVNPTPPADLAASVERGEARFQILCIPCHGTDMAGNGPVAAKMMTAADLLSAGPRARADGYIYSYIRHGGLIMPTYGAQATSTEAWDLVNYVRHMQQTNPTR